jgi:DNA-binding NtrC family response regulator
MVPAKEVSGAKQMATILLIEPEVLVRGCIGECLRGCGYRVVEGTSADDVWAAIEAGTTPDIVLAEVQLPGAGNGFSLASELRQTHPGISVILISGIEDAAQKSIELCARQGTIHSPCRAEDLAREIHLALARRRSAQAADDESSGEES